MQGKVMPNEAEIEVYVGIDVCKAWLDVYLHPSGQIARVANNEAGLEDLVGTLAGHAVALVALEATGKLHRLAHRTLHARGFRVAVVNPYRARRFAEVLGQLAKTDAIDARVLALFGAKNHPRVSPPAPDNIAELQEIVLARQAAVAEAVALANREGSCESRFLAAELARRIDEIKTHIKKLEGEIRRLIAADPDLARRFAILTSIPGIGMIVAASLVAGLAEIGTLGGKQIAALAGLAPMNRDSGEQRGQRHIKGGRAHVRTALYFAAVTAVRKDGGFARFAKRLKDAGKAPKLILAAVMRKLVVLANTLIAQNRTWAPIPPAPT
jgi:transposase